MRAMSTLAWAGGDEGLHDDAAQAANSDDIVVRDGIFFGRPSTGHRAERHPPRPNWIERRYSPPERGDEPQCRATACARVAHQQPAAPTRNCLSSAMASAVGCWPALATASLPQQGAVR